MSAREMLPTSDFARRFPGRFSAVLADARGAIAGVAASGNGAGGLLDAGALTRLHEIFRLRIELELEVAAVLWHTAEVVCAMVEATDSLNRRRAPDAAPGAWLAAARADEVATPGRWPAEAA